MQRLAAELRIETPLVGVGVDRLDYTKGIPERLEALDLLFKRRPDLRGQLTFVQIGVPSRSTIDSYVGVEQAIDRKVAEINDRYPGSGGPIRYRKSALKIKRLVALFRLANFCVVSSLHDGMNLVAKEFVAAREDNDGVLVLSEFAGAAQELHDALAINPYDAEGFADALEQAIDMPADERRWRMAAPAARGGGPRRFQLGLRHPWRSSTIWTRPRCRRRRSSPPQSAAVPRSAPDPGSRPAAGRFPDGRPPDGRPIRCARLDCRGPHGHYGRSRAAQHAGVLPSAAAGLVLATSAFMPWILIGEQRIGGLPSPAGFWILGLGLLAVVLAVLSFITRKNSRHPLLLVGLAAFAILLTAERLLERSAAQQAWARSQARAIVGGRCAGSGAGSRDGVGRLGRPVGRRGHRPVRDDHRRAACSAAVRRAGGRRCLKPPPRRASPWRTVRIPTTRSCSTASPAARSRPAVSRSPRCWRTSRRSTARRSRGATR